VEDLGNPLKGRDGALQGDRIAKSDAQGVQCSGFFVSGTHRARIVALAAVVAVVVRTRADIFWRADGVYDV
jgi:hypothetical protein